jgi:hypothetical protein
MKLENRYQRKEKKNYEVLKKKYLKRDETVTQRKILLKTLKTRQNRNPKKDIT